MRFYPLKEKEKPNIIIIGACVVRFLVRVLLLAHEGVKLISTKQSNMVIDIDHHHHHHHHQLYHHKKTITNSTQYTITVITVTASVVLAVICKMFPFYGQFCAHDRSPKATRRSER